MARRSRFFPSPESSDQHGLLGYGGKLSPEWLLDAYRHGIFPWPAADGTLAWWSLDPRGVIEFSRFHIARSLARTMRSGRFTATCNRDFRGVIEACGTVGHRTFATWLTPAMRRAYVRLHELGYAHSVEVWECDELVGGIYGVSLGGMFCAESMFHRATDASKVALARLVHHLQCRGYQLLDIQQLTSHTASLGACEIPRAAFLERVCSTRDLPIHFGIQLEPMDLEPRRETS